MPITDDMQLPIERFPRIEIVTRDRYDEALVEIERLKEVLRDIVAHKPGTPGLHYDSIELLLMSAIGQAEFALASR